MIKSKIRASRSNFLIFNVFFLLLFTVKTGLELVVRTCALESMTHQCGQFEFEDEKYEGCLSTCDLDGCNAGEQIHSRPTIYLLISFIVTVAHLRPVLTTLV